MTPPSVAQDEVIRRLKLYQRPSWNRGVGLTLVRGCFGRQHDAVLVQVQRPEHVVIARSLVGGDEVLGVPVLYEAVGDVVALDAPYDWCAAAHARLAELDALIAQGRGDTRVQGGGCMDPGGGIVPTTPTASELAATIRQQIATHQQLGTPCAPTSPPPFGRPEGHLGGTYEWWWWTFGRSAGLPYNPPAAETIITRNGRPVPGFSLGGPPVLSDCARRKIMDIEERHAIGTGNPSLAIPIAAGAAISPIVMALAGGAAGAVTSWVLEEVWMAVRGRRREREQ